MKKATASPCVRNCCLNEDDICLGCFRSLEDIVGWSRATEQQKQDILRLTEVRKADYQRKYGSQMLIK